MPGFAGFAFQNGGHTDYGWVELEFNVDGSNFPDSVTLLGEAYDNTGAPITTGETSGAPEPGTAGLMLLALGAAGVAALRRRKRQVVRS